MIPPFFSQMSSPQDGISYYVVAMARRSSSDLSLLEMHERSSCHPGIRTTVGWTVPIGYLVNTSQISVGEQCNFPRGETERDQGGLGGVLRREGGRDGWRESRGQEKLYRCIGVEAI